MLAAVLGNIFCASREWTRLVHQQQPSTNNPLKNKSPERPEQDQTPIIGMMFIQRKKDKGATVFRALLSLFSGPLLWESPFPSFQSMEPLIPWHQWQARGRTLTPLLSPASPSFLGLRKKRCNLEEDKNPPSTIGTAMGKLLIVYTSHCGSYWSPRSELLQTVIHLWGPHWSSLLPLVSSICAGQIEPFLRYDNSFPENQSRRLWLW